MAANLSSILSSIGTGNDSFAPFQANVTSFSVNLFSSHEETSIFQYHRTAPILNSTSGTTREVTIDTVYRIGSVSKVFTVLALLLQDGKIGLDDRVTRFIPELGRGYEDSEDSLETVRWDDVTIGALASHLAGIGRDCGWLHYPTLRGSRALM